MDDDANTDDSDGEPNEDKTFNVGNIWDIDNTTVNKIKKEKSPRLR